MAISFTYGTFLFIVQDTKTDMIFHNCRTIFITVSGAATKRAH